MNKDFYIGHELKKQFKSKIFALLMDYSSDKIWQAEDARNLNELIEKYLRADREFVQKTFSYYEKKVGCKVCVALAAAQGV